MQDMAGVAKLGDFMRAKQAGSNGSGGKYASSSTSAVANGSGGSGNNHSDSNGSVRNGSNSSRSSREPTGSSSTSAAEVDTSGGGDGGGAGRNSSSGDGGTQDDGSGGGDRSGSGFPEPAAGCGAAHMHTSEGDALQNGSGDAEQIHMRTNHSGNRAGDVAQQNGGGASVRSRTQQAVSAQRLTGKARDAAATAADQPSPVADPATDGKCAAPATQQGVDVAPGAKAAPDSTGGDSGSDAGACSNP